MKTRLTKNIDYPLILNLAKTINKPICFIGLKTTGLLKNPPIGVVEFAFMTINPDGSKLSGESLVNPGILISCEATHEHGIKDSDIAKSKKITTLIPLLKSLFSDCVISGFDICNIDLNVIRTNCRRHRRKFIAPAYKLDHCDIWYAASRSKKDELIDVAAKYGLFPNDLRRARHNVIVSAELLESMLARHGEAFVIKKILHPKGRSLVQTIKHTESILPPRLLSKTCSMRRAVNAHIGSHDRINALDYHDIAKQSDCSVAEVQLHISKMFSSKSLSKAQVEDRDIQDLIEIHIDNALEATKNAKQLKPIKDALEKLMGQDVDYVQLRVALFNWVTDARRHEPIFSDIETNVSAPGL